MEIIFQFNEKKGYKLVEADVSGINQYVLLNPNDDVVSMRRSNDSNFRELQDLFDTLTEDEED